VIFPREAKQPVGAVARSTPLRTKQVSDRASPTNPLFANLVTEGGARPPVAAIVSGSAGEQSRF
jgi:hypothetical protein